MEQKKPYNLEPNVEATLSYIPFVSIAVLMMEKENNFIRFHAFQSLFFWITFFGLYTMAFWLKYLVIGYYLTPILYIVTVLTWFYLMWESYNKREFELPIIGKLARDQM